jgi:uroporphyrinogen decarboxylase
MESRRTLVQQAIRFQKPPRVPVVFWNRDQTEGDVMLYHLSLGQPGDGSGNQWDWAVNEWGYKLEKLDDGTMGHPVHPRLPDWESAERFGPPAPREAERMASAPAFFERSGDRYRLASLDLSGFTVYTLLRGFDNSMVDFLLEPERAARLLDMIFQFECDQMEMAARHGFHGIHLADDWGTQSGLMISPGLFRQVFKPRYQRQFAWAHRLGLDVWYHSCGNVTPLAEDFHEVGVDVLNLAQPNVVDVRTVSDRLRGKQCFMMPISYQTVSIQGSPEEIYAEARRLYDLLATDQGGFIGYVEEYGCMGMSADNYQACGEAFRRLDRGKNAGEPSV